MVYQPRDRLNGVFNAIKAQPQGLTRLFRKPTPGSTVVIKKQRIKHTNQENNVKEQIRELNNEALIMETLHGLSSVPTLYATVYDNKNLTFYFFMEYVDGKTLGQILREKRATKNRLIEIYKNLNKALIQMWKRGVTHMDLHRHNIIVLGDNTVKIIDFGLAHKTKRVENIASNFKFKTNNDARTLWKLYMERYANALTIKSGYRFYNPDTKILAVLDNIIKKP
jgi:Kae1-associated kinase Bud32